MTAFVIAALFLLAGGSLSPDGQTVAHECPAPKGTGICVTERATGETRALITLAGRNWNPVYSPDGLFIAFIAEFAGRQVVSITDEIGHSWPVVEVTGVDMIAWSPDAVWLVVAAERKSGVTDILRITAGGTDPEWLTTTPDLAESSPRYDEAGRLCYRAAGNDICR